MPLISNLLRYDNRLQACLVHDTAHVTLGAQGQHVEKIQVALAYLDGFKIEAAEHSAKKYGPSPAAAVLSFKTKRRIINYAYQTQPDNIVGKMTIAQIDKELLEKQEPSHNLLRCVCTRAS